MFDNPQVQVRAIIKKAVDFPDFNMPKKMECIWFDSNRLIMCYTCWTRHHVRVMTQFCLTEKGSTALRIYPNEELEKAEL
jgi:hypothetical protein